MTTIFGASGIYPTPRGQPSIAFDLGAGSTRIVPAGTWLVTTGLYSCIQEYDPIQGQWTWPGGGYANDSGPFYINSDGFNYRVANLCGTIVGATVTTAGSAYTTAPTVSFANAAGAAATAIVGGAVSTTVTVTNAGVGYLWNPIVFLDSPPQGAGYQATATCTIGTGSTVSSVTINNQGAGYVNVPNIYFINDPRDTVGSGAAAVATLTGAGTVTQLLITNIGTANTTLQPTITFSSGSAVAFPIMVRTISALGTMTNIGSGYTGNVLIQAYGNGYTGAANILTNPRWTTNLVRTRVASIQAGVQTATSLTSAGASIFDGGIFAGSAPTAFVFGAFLPYTGVAVDFVAVPTFTWSNPVDTCSIQPV